ncbi:urease accessory protein UreF [Yoonia sediminilitoris]|uniref:Urease accessory protein UreF n=1 Tax=Yoonia sediminilitoris TaxID=1286148 RepID=A0A2T6KPX0_9RHOB|nr:urease accessory UreF family protein [Yoonia sediminilitoris]PUB18600.1 urease accessory protein [Yoonia sediminilitoris]RCW98768.1 urease accessory protein [Yoonia sediminilitoris]
MQADRLLTLTQWLSPAFPVGAFAWSHGLERAVSAGHITQIHHLADWLTDVLARGAGRTDAILLHQAHLGDDLDALADLAAALAPSRERRAETLQQGAAFAATTRAVWGLDLPDMAYPVAVGRAAGLMDMDAVPVAQVWLQAFASNLVQAATRLMPLGQTAAQKIVHDLQPLCVQIGQETANATLDDIGSATFAVDIASMQHATQHTRIFRS